MPAFRVLGLTGPHNFDDDNWFLEDTLLLHTALSQSDIQSFFHCAQGDGLGKHGNARAQRLAMMADLQQFSLYVEPQKIKKRFLEIVQDYASATTRGDRLLIIISGHGERGIGLEGAVNVGCKQNGGPKRLMPREILQLLAGCLGDVTIIVNSCYSGHWVEE